MIGRGYGAIFPLGKYGNRAVYRPSEPCEWHPLCRENRVLIAQFSSRFSEVGNGLRVFSATVTAWDLGKMLADLVKVKRLKTGKNEPQSILTIDTQSVKTAGKGEQRGFDGGKKVKGCTHQIVVDSLGNLHPILVHRANINDSKGGAVLADIVYSSSRRTWKNCWQIWDTEGFLTML